MSLRDNGWFAELLLEVFGEETSEILCQPLSTKDPSRDALTWRVGERGETEDVLPRTWREKASLNVLQFLKMK